MRLPNGYGSVYKLSGNRRNPWTVRVTVGFQVDGDRVIQKRKVLGSFPTKREALTALAEYHANPYQDKSMTLEELYEKWSDEHFPEISESNIKGVNAAWLVFQPIKNKKLSDLRLADYQRMVDESGKNTPTLKKVKSTLTQMYDYAVRNEILSAEKRDHIGYLNISKAGNPDKRVKRPFSKEELATLWSEPEQYALPLVLIYTGLRIGELLALNKEDLHLDEQWLYVRKAKTPAGVREVPIADKLIPLFESLMSDGGYTVLSLNGKPLDYGTCLRPRWERLMKDAGMQHKPHEARHTFISLCVEHGIDDRLVRQIVGHAGTTVTDSVYTHVDRRFKLDAVNTLLPQKQ